MRSQNMDNDYSASSSNENSQSIITTPTSISTGTSYSAATNQVSEIIGMLSFIQRQGKGQ